MRAVPFVMVSAPSHWPQRSSPANTAMLRGMPPTRSGRRVSSPDCTWLKISGSMIAGWLFTRIQSSGLLSTRFVVRLKMLTPQ
ncbi:hypothetical protein LP416_27640 [Polaromonas sp. P2-4]|nr:hypothetical protein LP416_27640 [Polaromonas sp. P2-4]